MSDPNTVTSEGAVATILVALIAYITTGVDDFCICVMYNGMAANGELMTYQNVRMGFFFAFFLIMGINSVGLFFGAVIPGGYVQLLGLLPFLVGLNQVVRMIYVYLFQKKKEVKGEVAAKENQEVAGINPIHASVSAKGGTLAEGEAVIASVFQLNSGGAESAATSAATSEANSQTAAASSSTGTGTSTDPDKKDDPKNGKLYALFLTTFANMMDPRSLEVAAVTFTTNIFYSCMYLPLIAVESRPCVGISIAVWFGCALTAYMLSRLFTRWRTYIGPLHSMHKYVAPFVLIGIGLYMIASSVITTSILQGEGDVKGLPDNGSSGHRFLRY